MTTTVTTPFLKSLQPVDMRTRHAKVAQRFVTVKGFGDVKALGHIPGDDCWYYYYDLPDGILELEVCHDPRTDTWSKSVVGLLDDPAQIRKMLGH
jgi:hypothetical protein